MIAPKTIVVKYGGNAMKDDQVKDAILEDIAAVFRQGHRVILVHGGGPFINKMLDAMNITSEFIGGHRKTTSEAIKYIEMALTGEVNASLVRGLQARGVNAVGLSGKDGKLVTARKKYHQEDDNNKIDIGWVGEVESIDPAILENLMSSGFFPVLTCMASDKNGQAYNINGDMFAGHIAGALKADYYVVMTDVDGLCEDKDRPETLINHLTVNEVQKLMGTVIAGGMIPKIDSCLVALNEGAAEVRIINGMRPGILNKTINNDENIGTSITK